MKIYNTKFIVIGADHVNTLGMIRSIGEQGIRPDVILISSKHNFTASSRYIAECRIVENQPNMILEALNSFCVEKPAILIPTSDMAVEIIDENYDLLSDKFITPSCHNRQGEIARHLDKFSMSQIAAASGLSVAAGFKINLFKYMTCDDLLLKMEENNMGFPIIIKALGHVKEASQYIRVIRSNEELQIFINNLSTESKPFYVQTYLDVAEEYGICGCSFFDGKTVHVDIAGVIHKIRRSEVSLGSTTYARITPYDISLPIEDIVEYLSSLEYTGIFDIEMIRTEDGRIYFIEINYRNGAYGYAFSAAGKNLPICYAALIAGNRKECIITEKVLINETADLQNVKAGKISLKQYIHDLLRADIHLLFNKKDIRPFIRKIIRR